MADSEVAEMSGAQAKSRPRALLEPHGAFGVLPARRRFGLRAARGFAYRPPVLETAFLPNATLAELYRFAWLLSGEAHAAERILGSALEGLAPKLEQIRSVKSRNVWLAGRIRQSCLEHFAAAAPSGDRAPRLLREEALAPIEILEIEAYIVAQRFHGLPEPDRSALALFYLDLLTPADSAKLLGLTLEKFCETLGRARVTLHEALRGLHPAPQPA